MRAEAALRQSEENLRNQAQELEQQLLASGPTRGGRRADRINGP
jgi:hypothetical protein